MLQLDEDRGVFKSDFDLRMTFQGKSESVWRVGWGLGKCLEGV